MEVAGWGSNSKYKVHLRDGRLVTAAFTSNMIACDWIRIWISDYIYITNVCSRESDTSLLERNEAETLISGPTTPG